MAQSHTRPTAVFWNELDTGSLKRTLNSTCIGQRHGDRTILSLCTSNCGNPQLSSRCKLLSTPS